MKFFYFLLLFLPFAIYSQKVQRSTLGISGGSMQITTNDKTYYVSQSFGQRSVIGTFKNNSFTIKQGFQQPPLLSSKAIFIDYKFTALVYPNPVIEKISVVLNKELTSNLTITIYDILGRIQYEEIKKYAPKFDLDLSFLISGTYFMKLTVNGENQQYKLIKN